MNWDKFKDSFDKSWHKYIKEFIESRECDEIYKHLKTQANKGVKIVPSSIQTFRAFELPRGEVKVVLLGYCPYHTILEGIPVADGLLFSCSNTNKLQPSLLAFYRGLEVDLYNGLELNYYENPDLSYLSKQGVLLLNSALTTEAGSPGKHQEIWIPFIKHVFNKSFLFSNIPIVLIGKDAQIFLPLCENLFNKDRIFCIEHPSAAIREHREWNTEGTFSKINKILENENKLINWLDNNEEPPF